MYKCIKGFSLEKFDDDGFVIDGEYMAVEENSIWYVPEENRRLIDGEIRLENVYGYWIEITKETLEKNFKNIS